MELTMTATARWMRAFQGKTLQAQGLAFVSHARKLAPMGYGQRQQEGSALQPRPATTGLTTTATALLTRTACAQAGRPAPAAQAQGYACQAPRPARMVNGANVQAECNLKQKPAMTLTTTVTEA